MKNNDRLIVHLHSTHCKELKGAKMFLVGSYLYIGPPWGRPLDIPLRGGVVPFEETPLLQQQFSN